MPITNYSERNKLNEIVSDESIPNQLKRDLRAGLKTLDVLEQLSVEASRTARDLLKARDDYRRDESGRIVDEVVAGHLLTLEDVLEEFPVFEANHALAVHRAAVLRQSVNRHYQTVSAGLFRSHAVDLLTATAEAVTSGEPVSPALADAWRRVEGRFRWNLPMVHRVYRFTHLRAEQPSKIMRKCWDSILAGDFMSAELSPGLQEIRFTGYWPEYTDSPK